MVCSTLRAADSRPVGSVLLVASSGPARRTVDLAEVTAAAAVSPSRTGVSGASALVVSGAATAVAVSVGTGSSALIGSSLMADTLEVSGAGSSLMLEVVESPRGKDC